LVYFHQFSNFFPWKEKTKQGGCKNIQNKNKIEVNKKQKNKRR